MAEKVETSDLPVQIGPRDEFLLSQLKPDADIDKDRLNDEISKFLSNLKESSPEAVAGEEVLTAVLIRDYLEAYLSPEQKGALNTFLFQSQMKSKPLIVYNLAASGVGKAVDHYFGNPETPFSYHLPGSLPYPLANELISLREDLLVRQWNEKFNKIGNPQMRVEKFTDPESGRQGIWMSTHGFAYNDRMFASLKDGKND